MTNVSDRTESTNTVPTPVPIPPDTTSQQASPDELLKRLKWGEPALTIVDIRDRDAFNGERITGAVPMPKSDLPDAAEPQLERRRDIYVYGDSDEAVADAANQLRQSGFQNVAELQGGLSAWKAIEGPTEGVYAFPSPAEPPQPAPKSEDSAQASAENTEASNESSTESSEDSDSPNGESADSEQESSDEPQS